jgi:hypothetical protein
MPSEPLYHWESVEDRLGKDNDADIARDLGCTRNAVKYQREKRGIAAPARRYRFLTRKRRDSSAIKAQFVLPRALHDKLKRVSARANMTMSAYVETALEEAFAIHAQDLQ